MASPAPAVFDADLHIHESYVDLLSYFDAEAPWRHAENEQRPAEPSERLLDTPGYHPYTSYDPILVPLSEDEPHRVTSPEILRADLDTRGVDAGLIFTGRLLFAALGTGARYPAMLARAYNRYLAERWVDPRRGIYAAIMAPGQDPEAAAGQIACYAKVAGFAAVYLPSAGNYPLWGDRTYDPIFRAAQEADLPVVLQGALTVHTIFPYELHHVPTALAKHTLSQSFGAQANLVSLITTGALARFPRLRVVFNDAGVAWLAGITGRLDHYHRYLPEEVPLLEARPGEYARRQVYLTTHPWDVGEGPARVAAAVETVGVEHLLYGSDWPHFDPTTPNEIRALPLPAEATRLILGENARRVYRL